MAILPPPARPTQDFAGAGRTPGTGVLRPPLLDQFMSRCTAADAAGIGTLICGLRDGTPIAARPRPGAQSRGRGRPAVAAPGPSDYLFLRPAEDGAKWISTA